MCMGGAKRSARFRRTVIDKPGCDEDRSDEPSTEGTRGHHGVIVVINHGTNPGVWGVLGKLR